MDANTRGPVQLRASETWPSGRRHSPAKGAYGPKPVSRVRIPASPPIKQLHSCNGSLSRSSRDETPSETQSSFCSPLAGLTPCEG